MIEALHSRLLQVLQPTGESFEIIFVNDGSRDESLQIADLGVETGHLLTTTHYAAPAKRSKGVMVKDVGELVAALKAKGLA